MFVGEVDDVVQLLTRWIGPEPLLVAARFDLRDDMSGDRVQRLADEIERTLCAEQPDPQ